MATLWQHCTSTKAPFLSSPMASSFSFSSFIPNHSAPSIFRLQRNSSNSRERESDPYWFLRVHHVMRPSGAPCCCWHIWLDFADFFLSFLVPFRHCPTFLRLNNSNDFLFFFSLSFLFYRLTHADGPTWIPAPADRLGLRPHPAARRHRHQIRSYSNVSLMPLLIFLVSTANDAKTFRILRNGNY